MPRSVSTTHSLRLQLAFACVRSAYLAEKLVERRGVERLEAQEQLASYLFHELRNDQNAILGVTEATLDALGSGRGSLPPAELGMLEDMLVHARHAATVIENMLDYARLRAGKLTLPYAAVDVEAILRECITLVKHLLRNKPHVRLKCTGVHLPRVLTSELHLRQVLINLLTNACKYTEHGFIELAARLVHVPNAADQKADEEAQMRMATMRFTVRDTGPGIPVAMREKVFEPFEKGYMPGTGIGLPLCSSLVKEMGGAPLSLTCPPSGGSEFTFDLQLQCEPCASAMGEVAVDASEGGEESDYASAGEGEDDSHSAKSLGKAKPKGGRG